MVRLVKTTCASCGRKIVRGADESPEFNDQPGKDANQAEHGGEDDDDFPPIPGSGLGRFPVNPLVPGAVGLGI